MARSQSLTQALAKLNAAQLQAVETVEGPVMVIAGPGTGKTQVLATRIAHILDTTDAPPSSILAISFTEAAAKNVRQRLVSLMGTVAYSVQIHTFHSFCTDVIITHPDVFPIQRDSQPLSDLERYGIIERLLLAHELPTLKPLNKPFYYLKDILRAIADLKKENVTVDAFDELVAQAAAEFEQHQSELTKVQAKKELTQLQKNQELAIIYRGYQEQLQQLKRFDFDDMVAMVVTAWQEQPELLAEYQEQLLYVLVDEYQDTNTAQNALVNLWASFWQDQANLCVVGDPHQAIYRFQGASVENVLSFLDIYPSAEVVTLETGYRCPQPIYTAAAQLIKHNETHVPQPQLQAALDTVLSSTHQTQPQQLPAALNTFVAPDYTTETMWVAQRVQQLVQDGVPAQEIAVLFRQNAEAEDIRTALTQLNIKTQMDGGSSILSNYLVQLLVEQLRHIQAIATGQGEALFYRVLQAPWFDLDGMVVLKLARIAHKSRQSLWQLLDAGYTTYRLKDPGLTVTEIEFEPVAAVARQFGDWAKQLYQQTLDQWLLMVIEQSGFVTWALQSADHQHLVWSWQALHRLGQSIRRSQSAAHLPEFLAALATLQEHGLDLIGEDSNMVTDAVHISTVHKAKGREWQYVFMIHCVDAKWGQRKAREALVLPAGILSQQELTADHRLADERRLFYVGLTRAKITTIISYAETEISETRTKEHLPSVFVTELAEHLTPVDDAATRELLAHPETAAQQLHATTLPASDWREQQQQFFGQLVADFKLSASALNAYLRDPILFTTNYVLRLPQPVSPVLEFGSAMHRALEVWGKQRLESGETVPLETLITEFEQTLARSELSAAEYAQRLQQGKVLLSNYYDQVLAQYGGQLLFVERMFGMGHARTQLNGQVITGRMDRVEWIDVASGTTRVIDYKTGKVKTMGDILGTTQSAGLSPREQSLPEMIRSPYQRQLLFYRLLAELDPSFKPTVTEGVLAFIEPDKNSGKLIERSLVLDDAGVAALKELIAEVSQEIKELRFLEGFSPVIES